MLMLSSAENEIYPTHKYWMSPNQYKFPVKITKASNFILLINVNMSTILTFMIRINFSLS